MEHLKRIFVLVLTIIMLVSILAGCARGSDGTPGNDTGSSIHNIPGADIELPEYVYMSEVIPFPPLPGGRTSISKGCHKRQ